MPASAAAAMGAEALLQALAEPGRTLVFCDDTDISGQPVPWLQPDLRILVAVEMSSRAYAVAAAELEAKVASLGMPEFHAAEIANPKGKSPWKGVPQAERATSLHFLAGVLNGAGAHVHEAHVPKAQFAALKAEAQLVGKVGVGFKQGLKRAFLRCLSDHLTLGANGTIVVMDQDKPLAEPVVEAWPEAAFLIGGGPVAARSVDVPGLQLADMAAWSINRYMCRKPQLAARAPLPSSTRRRSRWSAISAASAISSPCRPRPKRPPRRLRPHRLHTLRMTSLSPPHRPHGALRRSNPPEPASSRVL